MAFEPPLLVSALGALAALAGSIAAFFHVAGMGHDHYRRATGLASVSGFFLLVALALTIVRIPGPLEDRVLELRGAYGLGVLSVAALGALVLAANARGWNHLVDRGHVGAPDARHPQVLTLALGLATVALLALEFLASSASGAPARSTRSTSEDLSALLAWIPRLAFAGVGLLLSAAAAAHLATRRHEWADVALPWTRAAFLLAWVALMADAARGVAFAPGAANAWLLVALLGLVPLIHGLIYYRKKRIMPVLTPFFGALALPIAFVAVVGAEPSSLFFPALLLALPLGGWAVGSLAAPNGWARGAAVAVLAALAAAGFVTLTRAASAVRALPSNALAWTIVLAALLTAVGTAARRRPKPPPAEPFIERWIQMAPLVHVGMRLYALAFILVILFLARWGGAAASAPWAASASAPVLLVMGIALANQGLGRRTTLWLALAAAAAGAGIGLAGGGALFVVPVAAFAFVAAFVKTVRVSDTPGMPRDLRLTGVALLVGSVASILAWTGLAQTLPAYHALAQWPLARAVALALAALALAAGISTLRMRHHGLALVGAVALAVSLFWLVPLGLAAAAVIVRRRANFEAHGWRSAARALRGLQREFRKSGVYLLHVALPLLLLSVFVPAFGWPGAWLGVTGLLLAFFASPAGLALAPASKA